MIFKYYNFFIVNFEQAFSLFGNKFEPYILNIILPVGISFYTFQTLSYTIDIYRINLIPTRNFISFATFVSFFPQLVAGPIERAQSLLPQFEKRRVFKYKDGVDGLRQILWGLFKKMVVADNCAEYVNIVFADSSSHSGSVLLLGAVFFAFQIYGDFSGYSDIAIGTAKLFGIKLMQNFAFPYFSRDIAEFWRRWHISLSTWFRDYVYIPLGGSKVRMGIRIRNIFIIFLVSGFWHGTSWNFIVWGGLNALYFLPLMIFKSNRKNIEPISSDKFIPAFRDILNMGFTFLITVVAWIFFRSTSLEAAFNYLGGILDSSFLSFPLLETIMSTKALILLIFFMLGIEWTSRARNYALENLENRLNFTPRWLLYSFIIFFIGIFMVTEETPFIYFQF